MTGWQATLAIRGLEALDQDDIIYGLRISSWEALSEIETNNWWLRMMDEGDRNDAEVMQEVATLEPQPMTIGRRIDLATIGLEQEDYELILSQALSKITPSTNS